MQPREHTLPDGRTLVVRTAVPDDAPAVLGYVHAVSAESTFLAFGPGEFEFTEAEERTFIGDARGTPNALFLLGAIDGGLVSVLTFAGSHRPRLRHCGEFGISVRKAHWGLGIGGHMLDALIDWARAGGLVTKINLRVRTDNRRAIALYERKGFVREGTLTRDKRIDGVYYDNHLMGLQL
jgi:RimJ/RimL family protein N-acetyltransferase